MSSSGWIIPVKIQSGRLDEADEAMPAPLHSSVSLAIWLMTLVSQPSPAVWITIFVPGLASLNSRAAVSKGISLVAHEGSKMRTGAPPWLPGTAPGCPGTGATQADNTPTALVAAANFRKLLLEKPVENLVDILWFLRKNLRLSNGRVNGLCNAS